MDQRKRVLRVGALLAAALCLHALGVADGQILEKQEPADQGPVEQDSALYFTLRFPRYDREVDTKWKQTNFVYEFKEATQEMLEIMGLNVEGKKIKLLKVASWGYGLTVMAKVETEQTVDSALAHTMMRMNENVLRRPFDKIDEGAIFRDPSVGSAGTKYGRYLKRKWVTFQLSDSLRKAEKGVSQAVSEVIPRSEKARQAAASKLSAWKPR